MKRKQDKSTSKQRLDPVSKWLAKTYKKAFKKFSSPRTRENPDIKKFAETGNPKFLEKAIREREEIALDVGVYQIKMFCGTLLVALKNDSGGISPALSKKIARLCKRTLYATAEAHIPQKDGRRKKPSDINYDIGIFHTYRNFYEDIKKRFKTINRKRHSERRKVFIEYIEEKKLVEELKSLLKYPIENYENRKSEIAYTLSNLSPPSPSYIAWTMTSEVFGKSVRILKAVTANLRKLMNAVG